MSSYDTRGLGWRMHCCAEVTESSTNKQHHLSLCIQVMQGVTKQVSGWGGLQCRRGMLVILWKSLVDVADYFGNCAMRMIQDSTRNTWCVFRRHEPWFRNQAAA